MAKNQA